MKILGLCLIRPAWVSGGEGEMKMLTGQAWSRVLLAGGWVSHTWTPEGGRQEGFLGAESGRSVGHRTQVCQGRGQGWGSDLCCTTSHFPTRRQGQRGRVTWPASHWCWPGASESQFRLSEARLGGSAGERQACCPPPRCSVVPGAGQCGQAVSDTGGIVLGRKPE